MLTIRGFTGSVFIGTIAGYEGIICGASAIYLAMAEILNEKYDKVVLPVGIHGVSSGPWDQHGCQKCSVWLLTKIRRKDQLLLCAVYTGKDRRETGVVDHSESWKNGIFQSPIFLDDNEMEVQ